MNKLLIISFFVCFFSVHAFVKRDAASPATQNYFDDLEKQWQEFFTTANQKVGAALDPEQVKKQFSEAIDNLSKAINDFKAKVDKDQAKQ